MAKKETPRFVMLGSSKYVHVVHHESYDKKNSRCKSVLKAASAGKVPSGGMSPEAAEDIGEPCPKCDTATVLDEVSADRRKQEAKDKFKDLMDEERQPKKKGKGKSKDKPKGERKTASGPRSSGDKAAALVTFAEEHDWSADTSDAEPGILVTATKDDMVISCYFIDGKYDAGRPASISVGEWSGKLRGVHSCRRQIAGENPPHPKPGHGRKAVPRRSKVEIEKDEESEVDATRNVPFALDDEIIVIIDAIKGKTIRWRNGTANCLMEARLPSKAKGKKRDKLAITTHPKTQKRMVQFLEVVGENEDGESYGPERTVYLDRIVRVLD